MESNHDKIRNLLNDSSDQSLPPELDWASMKDGIFDKIHSMEQEKRPGQKKRFNFRRIGMVILLLLMTTIGLICFPRNANSDRNTKGQEFARAPHSEAADHSSINTDPSIAPGTSEGSKEFPAGKNSVASTTDNTLSGLFNPQPANDSNPSASPPSGTNKRVGNSSDRLNDLQGTNLFQSEAIGATISDYAEGASSTTPLAVPGKLSSVQNNKSLEALPIIHCDKITGEVKDPGIQMVYPIDEQYIDLKKQRKPHDQVLIEGGIVFWNPGNSRNKPENATYETSLPSLQIQGTFLKAIRNDYFILAGIQYQQLDSKFAYSEIIDNYKITLVDTIVQVQNNLLSGEQTIIHGNVDQFVKAERRIRHYNRTQLFKTSLGAGKSWRSGPFQTDVYLGGSLIFVATNKGRTVDGGSIINYNGSGSSIYQNQWTAEGFIGTRVHYFMSSRVGLTAGLQCQKALMNWRTNKDVNTYPLSFGFQFGLSYSLL